jgi:hypothetical protein
MQLICSGLAHLLHKNSSTTEDYLNKNTNVLPKDSFLIITDKYVAFFMYNTSSIEQIG